MTRRPFVLLFPLVVACVVLGCASPSASVQSARVLGSLRSAYNPAFVDSPLLAWDAGWDRLCVHPTQPRVFGNDNLALTGALRVGDFPAVRQIAPAGSAYSAMLDAQWLTAAQAYTPRDGADFGPMWGTVLFHAGQQAASTGDRQLADSLLTRAQALNGEDGPAGSPALASCLDAQGRTSEANDEWRMAASRLAPGTMTSRFITSTDLLNQTTTTTGATVQPAFALNVSVGAWDLAGFDLLGADLPDAPVQRARFYWRSQARPDELTVQSTVIRNLVANGSLTWGYVAPGTRPFGFPRSIYGPGLEVDMAQTGAGHPAICLVRGDTGTGAGLEGLAYPLDSEASLIVQGGVVASQDGSGFAVGHYWDNAQEERPYSYIASGPLAPTDWTTYVGTDVVPVGATAVRLWLQNNYGPAGAQTCFADLFMFELPAPPRGA